MASGSRANAAEIDRHATTLAKDPASKAFIPLAEEYGKAGMWSEAAGVLEDGLKYYPGFITAMVALGRAYDQLSQPTKAKAILEEAIKISPENLRAHRTLAKIYTAEGSTAQALRSCDVILALNPLDQESLSLRASLGAAIPNPSETPKAPSTRATVASSEAAAVAPDPHLPAAAELSALAENTDTAAEVVEPAMPDLLADATASMASVLETEQPRAQEPAPVEAAMTTALAAEQTPVSAPSRNQTATNRLEHMLQSIHARRRDRPSPEATTVSTQS
ncbi:MAG: tetratricopeptide repeat protein [Nitrospira sp.]|nr:tetratricopeptide repeat protein [Nitrospira sp.]